MKHTSIHTQSSSSPLVLEVKELLNSWIRELSKRLTGEEFSSLPTGKMLRTQLAWNLMPPEKREDPEHIRMAAHLCCAVELSHMASLFHDDVIDNGLLRRGMPTLWKKIGKGASILTGDMFLCEAITMILNSGCEELLSLFVEKLKQTCETEIGHEMSTNSSSELNVDDFISIARGKTGALFSFASLAGNYNRDDNRGNSINEEVGYRIGTVYQLIDDFIDVYGSEEDIGKTLGTDAARNKATIIGKKSDNRSEAESIINPLLSDCYSMISDQIIRTNIETFVEEKITPIFKTVPSV